MGGWGLSEWFYNCTPKPSLWSWKGSREVGWARLAGWEYAHCVSYAHERFFVEMTPVTAPTGTPFLLPPHRRFSPSPPPVLIPCPPPPTAKENSLTDPSPEALLLGQPVWPSLLPSLNPTFRGRGRGQSSPPFLCGSHPWAFTQLGQDRVRSLQGPSPVVGEEGGREGGV